MRRPMKVIGIFSVSSKSGISREGREGLRSRTSVKNIQGELSPNREF